MGHPKYVRDAGPGGEVQLSPEAYEAPCLSVALLQAKPNQFECYKTSLIQGIESNPSEDPDKPVKISLSKPEKFEAELKALLQHVSDRLELGLDEAWVSEQGYAVVGRARDALEKKSRGDKTSIFADPSVAPDSPYLFDKEEQWARAFTELFVFTAYGGTDKVYKSSGGNQALNAEFPRVFPIVAACQHLSTYAVLSRGFPASALGDGLGCTAGSIDKECFDSAKRKKSPDIPIASVQSGARQETEPPFASAGAMSAMGCTPGSVLVFNPGGPLYTDQDLGATTHIATMLRIAGKAVQFIDTGVVVGGGEKGGAEGGTTDHRFVRGAPPAAQHCVAVGGLKPAPKDVAEMAKGLQKSLPLGFVRLSVVDVGKPQPEARFISKLLPMRYPLSRFIWALRGLPIRDNLRVLVQVAAPLFKDSSDQLIAQPAKLPDDLFTKRDQSPLWEANIVRGEPSGSVVVGRHKEEAGVGKNGWVDNFAARNPLPANPDASHLQGTKLLAPASGSLRVWARSASGFRKCYVAKPGDKTATVDDVKTGVAFFDG